MNHTVNAVLSRNKIPQNFRRDKCLPPSTVVMFQTFLSMNKVVSLSNTPLQARHHISRLVFGSNSSSLSGCGDWQHLYFVGTFKNISGLYCTKDFTHCFSLWLSKLSMYMDTVGAAFLSFKILILVHFQNIFGFIDLNKGSLI
jgi:hypothetical protein